MGRAVALDEKSCAYLRTTQARSDVPPNVGRCQLRILENNPYNSMPSADLELAP
jgi:hypothetical protein